MRKSYCTFVSELLSKNQKTKCIEIYIYIFIKYLKYCSKIFINIYIINNIYYSIHTHIYIYIYIYVYRAIIFVLSILLNLADVITGYF